MKKIMGFLKIFGLLAIILTQNNGLFAGEDKNKKFKIRFEKPLKTILQDVADNMNVYTDMITTVATAIGDSAQASGITAIALGKSSTGSAASSIAIGDEAQSTATEAIAIGSMANSSDFGAIALGSNARATGADAIAIGTGVTAVAGKTVIKNIYGTIPDAVANITLADKDNVLGTVALADGQVLIGSKNAKPVAGNITSTNGSLVITNGSGSINVELTKKILPIVAGENVTMRTIDGNKHISVAVGTGAHSVAIGTDSVATASDTVAIGSMAYANGLGAIAFGADAKVIGNGAIAIGSGMSASAGQTAIKNIYETMPGPVANITLTDSSNVLGTVSLANGQVLIGSKDTKPVAGNLTSTNGTLSISNGAGTINLEVAEKSLPITAGENVTITTVGGNQQISSATGSGIHSVALGSDAKAIGVDAIAIGTGVVAAACRTAIKNIYGTKPAIVADITLTGSNNVLGTVALKNGEILIGFTGNKPVAGNITSSNGTLAITNGAGTINLEVAEKSLPIIAGENVTITTVGGNQQISSSVGSGANSVAIGNLAKSNSTGAVALGSDAKAIGVDAIAIGTGVIATAGKTAIKNIYETTPGAVANITLTDSSNVLGTVSLANGQVLIGSKNAKPVAGNITSTNGTLAITNGAGTINLEVAEKSLPITAGENVTITTVDGNKQISSATGSGVHSVALGSDAKAIGVDAIAIGTGVVAAACKTAIKNIYGTKPAIVADITLTGSNNVLGTVALKNGEILIGSTGNKPVAGNITSSNGTLAITNGAGTINLEVAEKSLPITAGENVTITTVGGNKQISSATGSGVHSVAVGTDSTASATNAIAIGTNAQAVQNYAIAIGAGAQALTGNIAVFGGDSLANGRIQSLLFNVGAGDSKSGLTAIGAVQEQSAPVRTIFGSVKWDGEKYQVATGKGFRVTTQSLSAVIEFITPFTSAPVICVTQDVTVQGLREWLNGAIINPNQNSFVYCQLLGEFETYGDFHFIAIGPVA